MKPPTLETLTPAHERRIAVILLLAHEQTQLAETLATPFPTIKQLYEADDRMPSYQAMLNTHFRRGATALNLARILHPNDMPEDEEQRLYNQRQRQGRLMVELSPAYYQSHFWTHRLFGNEGKNHSSQIPIYLTEGSDNPNINVGPYVERERNYMRKYRREARYWDR